MTVRRVPQDYPTIQAAVDSSAAGDSVAIGAGYAASESVAVSTDNLFFSCSVQTGSTLNLNGVSTIHIGGKFPPAVTSDADGATIYGGNGVNVINGGGGVDRIFAGIGDTVYGGGSDDLISVTGRPAYIDGGDGRDVLRVAGNTSFAAGSIVGIEQINVANEALAFFDAIDTSLTIQSVSAAGGATTVRGGSGNDLFYGAAGADRFVGNGGTDTFSYLRVDAGVTASLGTPSTNTGDAAGDTCVVVENLTGSKFNDVLSGDGHANVIDGGVGNDTIYGGKGDTLIGGAGNDTFVLDGHTSGAPMSIDGTASINIYTPDTNVIDVVGDTTFAARSTIDNIQAIEVANGVSLDLSAASLEQRSGGDQHITSLSLAGGGSTIKGSNAALTVQYFDGGYGADTLIGGKYNNQFSVKATPILVDGSTPGGFVHVFGAGIAINDGNFKNIYGFLGNNVDLANYTYSGKFKLTLATEGDNAVAVGTDGDDTIYQNGGVNGLVIGGAGVDTIFLFRPSTAVFHAGDTGLTATTLDQIRAFQTGSDKIQIDGISSSASNYAETAITSGSFDDAKAAATSLMADGTKDTVFVAGGAQHDGYLFWNADPMHSAPNQAIKLVGGSGLDFFAFTDIK